TTKTLSGPAHTPKLARGVSARSVAPVFGREARADHSNRPSKSRLAPYQVRKPLGWLSWITWKLVRRHCKQDNWFPVLRHHPPPDNSGTRRSGAAGRAGSAAQR